MQMQEKKIKGFSLIEILVVMIIVSVISAMAYPNFQNWKKEREVRGSAEKVRNIFTNTITQVQRGLYGFAQVYIEPIAGSGVRLVTRGMFLSSVAKNIIQDNDRRGNSETAMQSRCQLTSSVGADADDETVISYWDHDGSVTPRAEVVDITLNDVKTSITSASAVCFSKDARWYSANGDFIAGTDIVTSMYICLDDDTIACSGVEPDVKYLYAVSWSRFGNIKLDKWNNDKKEWISK